MTDQNNNPFSPSGEETVAALREWARDEIKSGPEKLQNLGKFFFAVSVGSAGFFISLQKLSGNPQLTTALIISMLFFFLSIIFSLDIVRPRFWQLHGGVNLLEEHKKHTRRYKIRTILWFGAWLIGVVTGGYATLF